MTPQVKKWSLFWGMFAIWLVGDLWTKDWADTHLATPNHPLAVRVGEADQGKELGGLLAERFGWDARTIAAQLPTMSKLAPAVVAQPGDSPFSPGGVSESARGVWLFWRDDVDLPPRRIPLTDRRELARWLSLAVPEAPQDQVNQVALEAAAQKTYEGWLPEIFRKLDAEAVAALLAEGRVHPIPAAEASLRADTKVVAGETYLVLDHQVPVSGEWWKFTYAENPGAAFGFMKGVAPGLRQTFFMLLTLVAFIVIGTIVARLPPTGWVVASSFGAILAGAAGNFVDRVRYGYVIDFIDMDLGFTHWPTFNVADIAIAVGVIALLLDLFFNKNSLLATKKKDDKAEAAAA